MVHALAASDGEEPRSKCAVRVELRDRLICFDEGFLRDFRSVHAVAARLRYESENPLLIAQHEFFDASIERPEFEAPELRQGDGNLKSCKRLANHRLRLFGSQLKIERVMRDA